MAKSRREKRLEAAVQEVMGLLVSLPSEIDYEADPENQSPEDMNAHMAGLMWQVCTGALEKTTRGG